MALAFRPCPGMPGVTMRFVDDVEPGRPQPLAQFGADGIGDAAHFLHSSDLWPHADRDGQRCQRAEAALPVSLLDCRGDACQAPRISSYLQHEPRSPREPDRPAATAADADVRASG